MQSLVVSLLLSLVSTLIFSRIGGVLCHRNYSTRRFPRFPPRNLYSLVMLAVLSRLRCNGQSLLLSSYLCRIGKIENPSCSACGHSSQDTSHLILHCPATDSLRCSFFGDSLFLYVLWPDPGELPGFLESIVFRHAPIPRMGSGKQQERRKDI